MKTAAIYARVSSDQQKEDKTIASQTATLVSYACSEGYAVPAEWIFEDEGVSGATLIRPGLERVRDLVAEGQIQAVLVLSPDRLSRKYAYQVLLIEEWLRHGVQAVFVNAPKSNSSLSAAVACAAARPWASRSNAAFKRSALSALVDRDIGHKDITSCA